MKKCVFALLLVFPLAAVADVAVDPSAATSTVKYEWCLTTASVAYPGPILGGAKNVTIENRSSATAYIEWDGTSVTTTGATGDKWAASDKWSLDVNSGFLGQAHGAATAAQTTGACMFIRQWK